MLKLLPLMLTASVAVAQPAAPEATPKPAAAAEPADGEAPAAAAEKEEAAPAPPPSSWDRVQERRESGEPVDDGDQPEEISWGAQLLKTLIALGVVVGLIYLVFKVGLVRLLGLATVARSGKSLRVLERVQLDARHALYLIELEEDQRLLIATGERGVQVLSGVDSNGKLKRSEPGASFGAVLNKTAAGETDGDGDEPSS